MAGVGSPGRVYTRTNSFAEDALEGGGVAIIDTKGGALGTGWWIEIKMRLGSWEVNATTMEALLLWSIASARVRRLRRSYAAIPPRTFSVKSMAELREVREKGWECTIWFVWGS